MTALEPHEINLRSLWRELAEKRIEQGVDWPRIVLTLFGDIEAAEARVKELEGMLCDGQHEKRCCKLHKTHASPHRGCILR